MIQATKLARKGQRVFAVAYRVWEENLLFASPQGRTTPMRPYAERSRSSWHFLDWRESTTRRAATQTRPFQNARPLGSRLTC